MISFIHDHHRVYLLYVPLQFFASFTALPPPPAAQRLSPSTALLDSSDIVELVHIGDTVRLVDRDRQQHWRRYGAAHSMRMQRGTKQITRLTN